MQYPFGGAVGFYVDDAEDGTSTRTAHEDMDLVRRTLVGLNGGGQGFLRLYRPRPTAAFSPRDTTLRHYGAAADAMTALGFEPVERRAGGQLAVYDDQALVIDLVAPHDQPRVHVLERFRRFSGAIASALGSLGVDARVGAVEGEYCPGDYSVNGAGRMKLAGVAQRIGRGGYHMGAVVSIVHSTRVKAAVARAYGTLGLPFEPATFGAVSDHVPDVDFKVVRSALRTSVSACVRNH